MLSWRIAQGLHVEATTGKSISIASRRASGYKSYNMQRVRAYNGTVHMLTFATDKILVQTVDSVTTPEAHIIASGSSADVADICLWKKKVSQSFRDR